MYSTSPVISCCCIPLLVPQIEPLLPFLSFPKSQNPSWPAVRDGLFLL